MPELCYRLRGSAINLLGLSRMPVDMPSFAAYLLDTTEVGVIESKEVLECQESMISHL
jgi:hypothetical protein